LPCWRRLRSAKEEGAPPISTSPKRAVRYTCSCGTEYLVAIHPGRDADWGAAVERAAAELGVKFVDAASARFVCTVCGVEHERSAELDSEAEPEPKRAAARA
jgi:hypothetical protein